MFGASVLLLGIKFSNPEYEVEGYAGSISQINRDYRSAEIVNIHQFETERWLQEFMQ